MSEQTNTCCLSTGCDHPAAPGRRGLCGSCYQALWRLVKQRKVTWRRLQADGQVLPSARGTGKRRNPAALRVLESLKSK